MQTVFVNVDCANLYLENSFRSAIVSQAVLWEKLKLGVKDSQFSKVVCEDGYEGWISNSQINYTSTEHDRATVTSNLVNIFKDPDERSDTIRAAGAGCNIPIVQKTPGWYKTILPDGETGWVKASAFSGISVGGKAALLELAPRFLGVPYFWGGKTAKGLDCSGYNQLLHKLAGKKIRRDSPMQFEDAKIVSENFLDGNPGDLLFFAENGDRITHVALRLNENEIIHARGRVRINSINKNSEQFDANLINTFVAVKTFFSD